MILSTARDLPLVLITGEEEKETASLALWREVPVHAAFLPVIKLVPFINASEFRAALALASDYIIFTSAFAVKAYADYCKDINQPAQLTGQKIIAISEKTASALAAYNLHPDIQPLEGNAKGILTHFSGENLNNKTFLLPRSEIGKKDLFDGLTRLGASVVPLTVYRNLIPDKSAFENRLDVLKHQKPSWIAFQSPSGISNFLSLMEIEQDMAYFKGIKIAVIGKTTGDFLLFQGVSFDFCPKKPSLEAIKNGILSIEGISHIT